MKALTIIVILLTSVSAYSFDDHLNDFMKLIKEFKSQPYSSEINSFVTDKCTLSPQSYLPFTSNEGWTHCCIEHDIAHWAGGNEDARMQADKRLKQCMKNVKGPAELFYRVVRVFGHPTQLMGNPKGRTSPWGYGWNYYIGHDELTIDQKNSVCNKLEQWQETDRFEEFHQTYVGMQGEVPIMPICD